MCVRVCVCACVCVPTERGLFIRERADGLYRVITYLLAKMFDELVIAVFATAIVAAWTFYGIQLQGMWVSDMHTCTHVHTHTHTHEVTQSFARELATGTLGT